MSNTLRVKILLKASLSGSCHLLEKMRHITGKAKQNNELPSSVGNAHGEAEIANGFKEVYSALYNSSDSSSELQILERTLEEQIDAQCTYEVNKITGISVKIAAGRFKPGKTAVSGSFTSDLMLKGPRTN